MYKSLQQNGHTGCTFPKHQQPIVASFGGRCCVNEEGATVQDCSYDLKMARPGRLRSFTDTLVANSEVLTPLGLPAHHYMMSFFTHAVLILLVLLLCGAYGHLAENRTFHDGVAQNASFDYVVVGGGTAGLTIAVRLAEQGYQVAVVEAGGYYEYVYPLARIPASCGLGAGADVQTTTSIDWGFVAVDVPGANFRDLHYPRGKCLGGS